MLKKPPYRCMLKYQDKREMLPCKISNGRRECQAGKYTCREHSLFVPIIINVAVGQLFEHGYAKEAA